MLHSTIAIDFGTTNSVACIYKNNKCELILFNQKVSTRLPSFVEYDGNYIVGDTARENYGRVKHYVIAAVKRILGLTFEEYDKMENKDIFGCKVIKGDDGFPLFVIDRNGKTARPVEVAAEIFKEIKRCADEYGNRKNDKAYITVPANYNDNQYNAIREAAELAGLRVIRLIPEPTAAAMSWFFDHIKELKIGDRMLVYDFGGGTFDVSLVMYNRNNTLSVISTDGDKRLGGNDIDCSLVTKLLDLAGLSNKTIMERKRRDIKNQCEKEKISMTDASTYYEDLSEYYKMNEKENSTIDLNLIEPDAEGKLTLKLIDDESQPFINKTLEITKRLLAKHHLMVGAIKYVFLVGGCSRLHTVRRKLVNYFAASTFPYLDNSNSLFMFNSVAEGAMKRLINDCNPNIDIVERIVVSYGLLTCNDDVVLILPKDEKIPAVSNSYIFSTKTEFCKEVETVVCQWAGDPQQVEEQNGMCIVPLAQCTKISKITFKIEEPKKELKFDVKFHLKGVCDLDVICIDVETNKLLAVSNVTVNPT